MATPSGFEPPISTLTGWRVRPLHHGAVGLAYADWANTATAPKVEPERWRLQMARGSRRGRGGANRARQAARPQGRRNQRGRQDQLPTAQAGAANAPVGASIRGNVQQPTPVGAPTARTAGGPRGGPGGAVERRDRRARAAAAMHDFHYVRGDLRWIAMTAIASVGLVLALWAAITL